MEHFYLHALHVLTGHPGWTLAVVFAAAFLESLAFIGTFIPGSVAMFIAGALIGGGSLDWWTTLACAVAGAVLGDGISYWIGHRYKTRIARAWPFRRHPELLLKGQAFFTRQGGKSIVLARFIGPIRAVIPVVAGMLRMNAWRFYAINVLSACIWAPAHILPGVVFGASLQLAGAVTLRLAILLVLLAVVAWGSVRLARFFVSGATPWVQHRRTLLLARARRSRASPVRLLLHLVDSEQSAGGALAVLGVLLLASTWAFLAALHRVLAGDALAGADQAVFQFFQGLRTPWADDVMAIPLTAGGAIPLLAVTAALTAWLAWRRHWRTIGYWLMAIGFSQVLVLVIKQTVGQRPPTPLAAGFDAYAFPSGQAATAVVVYGFLSVLVARRQRAPVQSMVTSATIAWLMLIAFSNLYLGTYWLSDLLGGVALGAAWLALVSLAYVSHRPPFLHVAQLLAVAALTATLTTAARINSNEAAALALAHTRPDAPSVAIDGAQWQRTGWQKLPAYRTDLEGDRHEPFVVQWAGTPQQITARMTALGWAPAQSFSFSHLLLWLAPKPSALTLPVLPQLSKGSPAELIFVRAESNPSQRLVLRLWPTRTVVRTEGAQGQPVWTGALSQETLSRLLRLVTVAHATPVRHPTPGMIAGTASLPANLTIEPVRRDRHTVLLLRSPEAAP